jgi:hypothetical protein
MMKKHTHRHCRCGQCLADVPVPAQDWVVTDLLDRGQGVFYRYQVRGLNLNYPACSPDRRFSWSVPALDERFDLTAVAVAALLATRGTLLATPDAVVEHPGYLRDDPADRYVMLFWPAGGAL